MRKLLDILEKKGMVQHAQDGPRYVYSPAALKDRARTSALEQLIRTFFGGSVEETAVALLELPNEAITPAALKRIAEQAARAKKRGR